MQLVDPPVKSSNIMALGYNPLSYEMQVKFKSMVVYSYAAVPEETYMQVFNASIWDPKQNRYSTGHSFAVLIKKGGFAYTKLGVFPENETPTVAGELPPYVQEAAEIAQGIGAAVVTGTEILGDVLQNFETPTEVPPLPITATPAAQEDQQNQNNPTGL